MEKYDVVKFVDNDFELDVRADKENETVWLTQEEMSELAAPLFDLLQRLTYEITEIALDQPGVSLEF